MKHKLHITGYSTARFSTWYFLEEWGLLFDAGDGVCSTLLGKAPKIKYVFLSHADRDHLTGLLQFNQLNARKGFLFRNDFQSHTIFFLFKPVPMLDFLYPYRELLLRHLISSW